jgi:hyperosmotically inducible periplasmic protein
MKISPSQLSVLSLLCILGLSACDKPNPAEDAGKKLDQLVDKTESKMDTAADKVAEAGDNAGEKAEDAAITTKIKAAFLAESSIKSLDINVTTVDGVVTLTGAADSTASSQKATQIAEVISEVKHVDNQLVVK